MRLIALAFNFGPILFGIGFLAPLIAAILGLAGLSAPLGLSPIKFGLVAGVILGAAARMRRTWLW
ncbi:hypothetical protein [Aquisediminimonas profunda]|uniref:hypothetical protein n=1 Tax=Aquisediminimonas profunda TaxID=1550733 RepID=UPI001C6311AF|nr:hypothetical protein [Aquisediminimonas profunda]